MIHVVMSSSCDDGCCDVTVDLVTAYELEAKEKLHALKGRKWVGNVWIEKWRESEHVSDLVIDAGGKLQEVACEE